MKSLWPFRAQAERRTHIPKNQNKSSTDEETADNAKNKGRD
jgi:hypothetical protein